MYDFKKLLELKKTTFYSDDFILNKNTPAIYTFDYLNFGKHIYAQKGDLIEDNYIEIDSTGLPEIGIGIGGGGGGKDGFTIPVTSPLSSVTNYWMYTKKNDKLVLQWQKSEYLLDNGKIKTITKDDKNVSAAMLFSDTNTTTVDPTSPPSETVYTSTETINIPVTMETRENEGFIFKLITMILSWFK